MYSGKRASNVSSFRHACIYTTLDGPKAEHHNAPMHVSARTYDRLFASQAWFIRCSLSRTRSAKPSVLEKEREWTSIEPSGRSRVVWFPNFRLKVTFKKICVFSYQIVLRIYITWPRWWSCFRVNLCTFVCFPMYVCPIPIVMFRMLFPSAYQFGLVSERASECRRLLCRNGRWNICSHFSLVQGREMYAGRSNAFGMLFSSSLLVFNGRLQFV